MSEKKSIYELEPHEGVVLNPWMTVTRVPGGWIYKGFDEGDGEETAVFVPFDNEFQEVG